MTIDRFRRGRTCVGVAACWLAATSAAWGQSSPAASNAYRSNSYVSNPFATVDPFDVAAPAAGAPTVYVGPSWQTQPFGVGYNLLGGYRRVVSGARQPIGHEHIGTGPNSYVYRPVYAADGGRWPDGGSRRLPPGFGPIIIDYPGTIHERRYAPRDGSPPWENADVSSRTVPQVPERPEPSQVREF